jgi:CheY-like chemotaxis protein
LLSDNTRPPSKARPVFLVDLCDFYHASPWYEDMGSASPIFSGAVVGGSIFVLFVDNDAAFADAAARSLEAVGMRTFVAMGSTAALDAFDSTKVDVVVTDMKLPAAGAQGLALAQMIGNGRRRAPVILMTTYPEFDGEIALPGSVPCNPLELAELCREIKARMTQ